MVETLGINNIWSLAIIGIILGVSVIASLIFPGKPEESNH